MQPSMILLSIFPQICSKRAIGISLTEGRKQPLRQGIQLQIFHCSSWLKQHIPYVRSQMNAMQLPTQHPGTTPYSGRLRTALRDALRVKQETAAPCIVDPFTASEPSVEAACADHTNLKTDMGEARMSKASSQRRTGVCGNDT